MWEICHHSQYHAHLLFQTEFFSHSPLKWKSLICLVPISQMWPTSSKHHTRWYFRGGMRIVFHLKFKLVSIYQSLWRVAWICIMWVHVLWHGVSWERMIQFQWKMLNSIKKGSWGLSNACTSCLLNLHVNTVKWVCHAQSLWSHRVADCNQGQFVCFFEKNFGNFVSACLHAISR